MLLFHMIDFSIHYQSEIILNPPFQANDNTHARMLTTANEYGSHIEKAHALMTKYLIQIIYDKLNFKNLQARHVKCDDCLAV